NLTLWDSAELGGERRSVHSVLEAANGDVWIAAEFGSGRFVGGKEFEAVLRHDIDVTAMCEDSQGRIFAHRRHIDIVPQYRLELFSAYKSPRSELGRNPYIPVRGLQNRVHGPSFAAEFRAVPQGQV